ncbi:ABC transporter ATP-binding protein [Paenibacillus sp. J22TS3]|uniref:ABC transporter ATP-binding protein n=1 Tax=Paenibacillus sp. J22TS3 TaxID=2807192 RepID=UPI001B01D8D5|nr:ABC transporter ATP-binding protein [Paenibacillus sp. J22TS3]GIP22893.1 bacteriocin ABC transporter ATP-binding protein [Paenibacillus sp. J22TS3]
MNPICQVINVNKSYHQHRVLEGVSLAIEPGEMVAVMGPSGSGKSTLLNIIGMLEKPESGEIKLFGKSIPSPHSQGALHLLRDRIAYLFQNFALIEQATIEANLEIPLLYQNMSREKRKKMKEAALAEVGLSLPLKQHIYELSGGEQQRVAIARILLKKCDFILADEPTGSLDEKNRDEILILLKQLNDKGKTLMIVTHDPVVAQACSRTIYLS